MHPNPLLLFPWLLLLGCSGEGAPDAPNPADSPSVGATSGQDVADAKPAADPVPIDPVPIDPANTGTLTGFVAFTGDPPPIRPLENVPDQPGCHEGHETPPISEFLIVENGRVRNVFVSIEEGLEGWIVPPAPAEAAALTQQGCIYRPHALGIQLGQKLKISNADPTNHNVNAAARKNTSFNQNQGPGFSDIEVTYEYAEVVPFRCDIHPWMSAYVGVFAHPFFDVTGSDGAFRIEGLPPGTYTVEAQHPDNKKIGKKGKLRSTVEIRAGEVTQVEFAF